MRAATAALLCWLPYVVAADLNFQVSALDGASIPFAELRGEKVTVVLFLSTKCPISQAYQQRVNRLYRDFSSRTGLKFTILNANANEPVSEIQQSIRDGGLAFPVYKDFNNRAADAFDAQTTPEAFVLDSKGVVRYHGAIDDATNEARVKNHALRNAIEALLAGKAPATSELKAFGCVLKRAKRTS